MIIRLNNLKVGLDTPEEDLLSIASQKLRVAEQQIKGLTITKQSLDARKHKLAFVYSLDLELEDDLAKKILRKKIPEVSLVEKPAPQELVRGTQRLKYPPIVIGAGPCGLFAALKLARLGYRPLVLERGKEVEQRQRDVDRFWETGELNLESNVQFGEGGAGTFSDGKLTTRSKDPRVAEVLETFVAAGAPPEIRYLHKPHLGTDQLRRIVRNMRETLISLGGQVLFQAKVPV